MSTIELKATTRDIEESLNDLRKKRFVPAVLYGHGIKNQSITVILSEFVKAYKQAGESTLVDLIIGDAKPIKVLVHAISRDVETNVAEHIDFYQVNMKEKLHADIPVVYEGESSAVKAQGGTLMTQIQSIPVSCLPGDLVDSFKIDISVLDDFTKRILLSDIKNIPETMEVMRPMDSVVALVSPPRVAEVDIKPEEATEDGDATTEGAEEGTKEGDETAGSKEGVEKETAEAKS